MRIDPPPAELTALVDKPPPLTSGKKAAVTKALAGAYSAARVCRVRHGALVEFLERRDGRLRGGSENAPRP